MDHFFAMGQMSESEYKQLKSFMQMMKAPPHILEALHAHYQKHKTEQVIINKSNKSKLRKRAKHYHHCDKDEIVRVE